MAFELILSSADRILSIMTKVPQLFRRRDHADLPADSRTLGMLRLAKARKEPRDIELFPVGFDVDLAARVPRIEVSLRAVNHLSKTAALEAVRATLYVGGLPGFERLELVMGIDIPPRNSSDICCRRELVESEIRLLRESLATLGPHHGSVQFAAHARTGRKTVRLRVWQPLAVRGWVAGLPPARSLTVS